MSDKRYEHFSKGDLVYIEKGRYAGRHGYVESMTNAGFRGIEYNLLCSTEQERFYGVSAADLVLQAPVPVVPWPRQWTYRNGRPIGPDSRRRTTA